MFNALYSGDLYSLNGVSSGSFIYLNARGHLNIKNDFMINSTFLSSEGDMHSQPKGEISLFSSLFIGTKTQPDVITFGMLAADGVPITSGFL